MSEAFERRHQLHPVIRRLFLSAAELPDDFFAGDDYASPSANPDLGLPREEPSVEDGDV